MGLVADVFKLLLIDPNSLDVVGSTTLQDANIEVSVQTNDVRAGQGNQLMAILHANRDINISATDVDWKYDYLAMVMGQDIKTGAGVAYAMPKTYIVSGGKISLDNAPKLNGGNPEMLKMYKDGTELTTGFTVAAKDVTFTTGANDGDVIDVKTYRYATSAQTKTIEFDSTKFSKNFICALETIEINEEEQPTHTLQYQFDNAKVIGDFSINTQSERDARTQQLSLRVLKPKHSTIVGRALRIPIAE